MLGRQVGSSLLRLPIHARLVLRPTAPFQSQCPQDLAPRAFLFSSQRYYATPGRPRKAVGEPSKPVKRAAKRQAKDTSGTDPATKLVKARKPTANSTAKKAAGRSTAKKPVGRPKTKNAAPKKKPLTERQKRLRVEAKERAKIKELRELALKPPPRGTHRSAYQMFVQERGAGRKGQQVGALAKEWSQEWKSVTPAQQEHYNHLAHEATAAAQAELKRWVESHSPAQIKEANRARATLSKKLNGKTKTNKLNARYKPIPDERIPKAPISSYMLFSMNRQASGDFQHIAVAERGKLLGKEWAALTADEKKKYKDLQHEEQTRYSSEFKDTYGYVSPYMANSPQSASASA